MRNIFLTLMFAGSLFAEESTLSILSITDVGDGNATFTLGYDFAEDVAGFQFDLLSDAAFTMVEASGGACAENGFEVTANSSGRVIGFSFSGAVIPAGAGTFLTLTGTYDSSLAGTVQELSALEDCDTDGDPACSSSETRMILSSSAAGAIESSFTSYWWTIGDGSLDNGEQPMEFALSANYPNPFNPTTTIDYSIATAGDVSIIVYDMMGREVKSLVADFATPGTYSIVWDATNNEGLSVSAGMYVYKMISGNFVEVNKMLLVK